MVPVGNLNGETSLLKLRSAEPRFARLRISGFLKPYLQKTCLVGIHRDYMPVNREDACVYNISGNWP